MELPFLCMKTYCIEQPMKWPFIAMKWNRMLQVYFDIYTCIDFSPKIVISLSDILFDDDIATFYFLF